MNNYDDHGQDMAELDRIIRTQAARIAVLEGLLRECIAAASADKVEDFSAVSNAADRANEALRAAEKEEG